MPQVEGSGEFRTSDRWFLMAMENVSDHNRRLLVCSVIDDEAIFEGDILIGPALERFGTIALPRFWWPEGRVPYCVDPGLAHPEYVQQAIEHWHEHTPVRFEDRDQEDDYVDFVPSTGCSSWVGRQEGRQELRLSEHCAVGNVIHEIGHAVGLWHEQSREDRDDHVQIVWSNIDPRRRHNFEQHVVDGDDVGAYDYGSIMHYPPYAFALDPRKPTIVTKTGDDIGQREGLSEGDIQAVEEMYS